MSTDRLATEASTEAEAAPDNEPSATDTAPEPASDPVVEDSADAEDAPEEAAGAEPEGEAGDGTDTTAAAAAPEISEAQAELAAQRELRAKIEQRKAEKSEPVAAGAKLSGTAADLLAAVRAVESGEKPAFVPQTAPAPRRPEPAASAPVRAQAPAAPAAPAAAAPSAVAAVRDVLVEGGAPEALAAPAAEALGDQAADALREDPWKLLSVPGVRPEQADTFARALIGAECAPGDERRATALVGWLLERAALQGHTVLESETLRAALAARSVPDADEALQSAIEDGAVLVFQDPLDDAPTPPAGEGAEEGEEEPERPVRILLGLERFAMAEEILADGLGRLANAPSAEQELDWESAAKGAPSPSAAELIRAVAAHGLVAHTGGEAARAEPVALIAAARALGLRAVAAAHSADGRNRLAEALGDPEAAVTVSGLLAGDEGDFDLGLLAVVDAPQLDVETAAVLVESLPDGCRLVLSGDPGVLGSAGAGQVFTDVLAARACPQIASRTPDPGPIGELVSGIGIGELNQVEAPGKEVVIVPVRDAGEAVHRTVQLVADSVPRAIGVPSSDTQVITPGHGGSAGTRALNTALKERLNPGPGRFAGFDPGDRVAHVAAPGRTVSGTVVSADAEGLHLDCAGTPVVVPKERVETSLRHGWALTAHQAAGMRWPAVVVVLPGDAAQALSRPWVYTAFGRGERHLSVVHGVDQALPQAVAGVPAQERTTRLRTLLRPSSAE
ncbi:ATP-binding domain-containing protein [Streptomyces sp. NBC_01465]|nr:helix-hairpin-helix domain-containing protein [Streptomyces sp. NBC_01465]